MKLRKEFENVLEHILDIRYANYVNLQEMKVTGYEVIKSIEGPQYDHKLSQDTIEQLDGMIESAHQKYLDALQFVVALGYESFVDENQSEFCDSGRVHRIFLKEEISETKEVE